MCGIAGILAGGSATPDELTAGVTAMTDALVHRGPDDAGEWLDAEAGIALGHRRLNVVDVSEAAAQPFLSSCGRYVIVSDGMVYNAVGLREELIAAGRSFRAGSDAEVVVEACAHWGIETAARRLVGAFAFALWDREERSLTLVRDRLGVKPLYWADTGKSFLFGSELRALRAHPSFRVEINHDALAGFLRLGYIGAPNSIYRGVFKLQPGRLITLHPGSEAQTRQFWRLDDVIAKARRMPFDGDQAEADEALDALLREVVRERMQADVLIGALLSGGTGSPLITALMQEQSDRPIPTFSVGFAEDNYKEAGRAKVLARHLGTAHTELHVSTDEALDVVPRLPEIFDEPFADPGQIPAYLVSRLACQSVGVALSGDGGDETFGGYTRYLAVARYRAFLFSQPPGVRNLEARLLRSLTPSSWDFLAGLLPETQRPTRLGDKIHKLANVLSGDPNAYYSNVTSHWDESSSIVIGARGTPLGYDADEAAALLPDLVERMQYLDTVTALPDDVLTRLDRASMAVSLQARVPLLDHRVVAFAWGLPRNMKIRRGQGKFILRRLLDRYIPKGLVDPPRGFSVPIDAWLRGPLQGWAEELLDESRIRAQGYFKPELIRRRWQDHLSGRRKWHKQLWDVLMFQAWLERWK